MGEPVRAFSGGDVEEIFKFLASSDNLFISDLLSVICFLTDANCAFTSAVEDRNASRRTFCWSTSRCNRSASLVFSPNSIRRSPRICS